MYWSVDYKTVHIVALAGVLELGPGSPQYEWLARDLARAAAPQARSKRPWIIVTSHFPMYCTINDCFCGNYVANATCQPMADGTRPQGILDMTAQLMLEALEPLLLRYGVDVFLSGHEHAYVSVHRATCCTAPADPTRAPCRALRRSARCLLRGSRCPQASRAPHAAS